jgi:hypothetical protein
MGFKLLHGDVVLSISGLCSPDVARSFTSARCKEFSIVRNSHGSYGLLIYKSSKLLHSFFSQVPNAYSAALVAIKDISLVRMEDCCVNHDSVIVVIPHEA